MAQGIGHDMIEVERIKKNIAQYGQHFLDRIYTQKERKYCEKHRLKERNYAGRFAAKEAVAKAFGVGFGKEISWKDIEILNDEKGKPIVFLSDKVQKRFGNPKVLLSISHVNDYASAVAIWC